MRYCMQYKCYNKHKSKRELHTFPKIWRMFPASSIETVFKVHYANVSAADRVI